MQHPGPDPAFALSAYRFVETWGAPSERNSAMSELDDVGRELRASILIPWAQEQGSRRLGRFRERSS